MILELLDWQKSIYFVDPKFWRQKEQNNFIEAHKQQLSMLYAIIIDSKLW